MTPRQLARAARERLLPFFERHGFRPIEPLAFRRDDERGYDVVRLEREKHRMFAVRLMHIPHGLLETWITKHLWDFPHRGPKLSPHRTPYLAPDRMRLLPRWWMCRAANDTALSFAEVERAFEMLGEPWLRDLRDPVVYAREVTPVITFIDGVAWEAAGDLARARLCYERMSKHYEWMRDSGTDFVKSRGLWDTVLFIASRIEWEPPFVQDIRRIIAAD